MEIDRNQIIINVDKIAVTKCQICQRKFGIFNREHTCKRCFRIIDEVCSRHQEYIINYNIEPNKKHKVCDYCYKESEAQKQLKQSLDLQFGKDCKISKSWYDKLGIEGQEKDIENKFNKSNIVSEQMSKSMAYQSYLDSIPQISQILKDNYKDNYSFMEFYHYMTQDIADGEAFKIIGDVIRAFLFVHCETVGYNNDVFDLAVFLLMFFKPYKAWIIMCKIYEDIIPKDCYPLNMQKNNFKLQIDISNWILSIVKERQQLDVNQIAIINEFINVEGLHHFSSFCIGKLNIQTTFFLINYIFNSQDKLLSLIQIIASITSLNCQLIIFYDKSTKQISRVILENTQQDLLSNQLEFSITKPNLPYFSSQEIKINEKQINITESIKQQQFQPPQQVQKYEPPIELLQQQLLQLQQELLLQQDLHKQQLQKLQNNNQSSQQQKYEPPIELLQQQLLQFQQEQLQQQEIYENQQQKIIQVQLLNKQNNEEIFQIKKENQILKQELNKLKYECELLQNKSQKTNTSNEKMLQQQVYDLQEQMKRSNESYKFNLNELQMNNSKITIDYEKQISNNMNLVQQNKQLQEQIEAYKTFQSQKISNQQNNQEYERQIEVNRRMSKQIIELQDQIGQLNEQISLIQNQKSFKNIEIQQNLEKEQEISRNLKYQIQDLQDQIRKINDSYKIKLQQDRNIFQQEFEQSQEAYEQLETKFLNSCMKIMLLTVRQQIQSQNQEEDMQAQDYNQSRKGTMSWQSEIGVLTVKLNNKEKECERLKKSLKDFEDKYEFTTHKIKEEYELISNQELKKVSSKFQIEKSYYEEQIESYRKKIKLYENSIVQMDQLKIEIERINSINIQLKQKCQEYEGRYNQKSDEMDALLKRHDMLQQDHYVQVEQVKKHSNQSQFEQKIQKYITEIELLQTYFEDEKNKSKQISKRYIIQSLELQRVNILNENLYSKVKSLGIQNDEYLKLLKDLDKKLQQKDLQISVIEQELNSFKTYSSQIKGQDQTEIVNSLERQIFQLNEKTRKLIDDNSLSQFNLENLRIQFKNTQNNLEFSNNKLQTIKNEHDQEIKQLKEDYENVVAHTVNTCQQKIDKFQNEWKQKESQWKEKEKKLKQTIELFEEKITMLSLELQQCQLTIQTLEDKIAVFSVDLKQKIQQISEQDQRIKELEIILQQHQQKIYNLEINIDRLQNELKLKIEFIEKQDIQIQNLNKEIQFKNIRLQEQEEKIIFLSKQLSEQKKYIDNMEQEIKIFKYKIEDYERQIAQYKEKIAYYELEMEKKRSAFVRITLLGIENKRLKDKISFLTTQLDEKQNYINSSLQDFESLKQKHNHAQKKLSTFDIEISSKKKAYVVVTLLSIENKRLQKNVFNLNNQIKIFSRTISDQNQKIDLLENKQVMLTIELKQNREYKEQLEKLQYEMREKQNYIESLLIKIKSLEDEINRWKIQSGNLKMSSEQLEIQIQIVRNEYHKKMRETLKRYVLIFTELCRQRDNVQKLEENLKDQILQNQILNDQYQSILSEISEARLQLENMQLIKKQLSKKNLEITILNSEHDILKENYNKSLMRLIILSMELERITIQKNLLQSNVFNRGRSGNKNESYKFDEQLTQSQYQIVINKSTGSNLNVYTSEKY